MVIYAGILIVGLLAGMISGVIGTGASLMLLPILVYQFGPKLAVPIMAMAALMGNMAKVLTWWREVDWRAVAAYSILGVPAAALGARTLLALDPRLVDLALGTFFLIMIPTNHWLRTRDIGLRPWQLSIAGGMIGYLTGIVISTGPLSVPAFTAYGLAKGAFLSTEAMSSLLLFASKIATFRGAGALSSDTIAKGVLVGSSMMAGTFLGKAVVLRMSAKAHARVLDALLLISGLSLVWQAGRAAAA